MSDLEIRLLRIDLTKGKITREVLPGHYSRDYLGGSGVGVRLVYDEVPPGIDALDPQNRLVFALSPLTGTAVPGACRYLVVGKSPQTLFTVSISDSGGFFGPELKFAGCDVLLLQGAASQPVYIHIDDDSVEIRDASALWGKDAFETEEALRGMLGDDRVKVAAIGPAGENLVRLACIVNDRGHTAGRGGFGAVMGSKKVKAIAVRGRKRARSGDRERLAELVKKWKEFSDGTSLHKWGTGGSVRRYYETGMLPIKNLTTSQLDIERLTGQYIRETFPKKRKPCYGCHIHHVHTIEVTEGPYKGFVGEEPEYETLAGFGSNLGITDAGAVSLLGETCDRLGMDVIGTSWAVSLAMELYEKGILPREGLGGLDLKWGNAEAVLTLLGRIARRQDFGGILAEGAALAAERIGGEALNYVVSTKKHMSPKCIDTRGLPGRSLAFAVGNSGPRNEHSPILHAGAPDPELGFPEGMDMRSPKGHAAGVRKGGIRKTLIDASAVCSFTIPAPQLTRLLEAFHAATGRRIEFDEAMTIGERILNVQRCFNIRHGLTPADDDLEERLLTPQTEGPGKGISVKKHLRGMVREYYDVMGWDPKTGKPLRSTLRRLGLEKEEKDLWG